MKKITVAYGAGRAGAFIDHRRGSRPRDTIVSVGPETDLAADYPAAKKIYQSRTGLTGMWLVPAKPYLQEIAGTFRPFKDPLPVGPGPWVAVEDRENHDPRSPLVLDSQWTGSSLLVTLGYGSPCGEPTELYHEMVRYTHCPCAAGGKTYVQIVAADDDTHGWPRLVGAAWRAARDCVARDAAARNWTTCESLRQGPPGWYSCQGYLARGITTGTGSRVYANPVPLSDLTALKSEIENASDLVASENDGELRIVDAERRLWTISPEMGVTPTDQLVEWPDLLHPLLA